MSSFAKPRAARPISPLALDPPPPVLRERVLRKRALFEACQYGTWLEVSQLMDAGALLFSVDPDGLSPLHYACLGNNYDVALNFFQEKGKMYIHVLNWRSKSDETPLLMACRLGHADLVDLFIDRSAKNSKLANEAGETPLHVACMHGHESVVRRLLVYRNVDIHAKDRSGNVPLHLACLFDEVDVVRTLLENQADVNCKNRKMNGYTPLFVAVVRGHQGIVKLILQKSNPDLTATDCYGRTALHLACRSNNGQAVKALILIADEAFVDSLDDSHCTPLHYVCKSHRLNLVKWLLAAGAKTNIVNHSHETPLFLASKNGMTETVRLLLEHGAKVYAANVADGPVRIAIRRGHVRTATTITDHLRVVCSAKGVINALLSCLIDQCLAL